MLAVFRAKQASRRFVALTAAYALTVYGLLALLAAGQSFGLARGLDALPGAVICHSEGAAEPAGPDGGGKPNDHVVCCALCALGPVALGAASEGVSTAIARSVSAVSAPTAGDETPAPTWRVRAGDARAPPR